MRFVVSFGPRTSTGVIIIIASIRRRHRVVVAIGVGRCFGCIGRLLRLEFGEFALAFGFGFGLGALALDARRFIL
jgi:hypothetical protein